MKDLRASALVAGSGAGGLRSPGGLAAAERPQSHARRAGIVGQQAPDEMQQRRMTGPQPQLNPELAIEDLLRAFVDDSVPPVADERARTRPGGGVAAEDAELAQVSRGFTGLEAHAQRDGLIDRVVNDLLLDRGACDTIPLRDAVAVRSAASGAWSQAR